MAENKTASTTQLKTLFDASVVDDLAGRVAARWPAFDRVGFRKAALDGLDRLELKARSAQIAAALAESLPEDFEAAAEILTDAMGRDDGTGGLEGFQGFRFMPCLDFVALRGLDRPDAALAALECMTVHFSAEFAIRPFILEHPDETLPRLMAWSGHRDWRVRRLASEGSRPRLPWAQRLPPFVADPSPVIAILDRLHADPHEVVRRSVANNLNDIAKDHTDLAVETARRWQAGGGAGSAWTVRHGLRSLVKRGHSGALALLGYSGGNKVEVEDLAIAPAMARIGGAASFSFTLVSRETEEVRLVVDYALDRMLAGGKRAKKVFKLSQVTLAPGEAVALKGTQRFRQLTTRTHYPGPHAIEILINGAARAAVGFELSAA